MSKHEFTIERHTAYIPKKISNLFSYKNMEHLNKLVEAICNISISGKSDDSATYDLCQNKESIICKVPIKIEIGLKTIFVEIENMCPNPHSFIITMEKKSIVIIVPIKELKNRVNHSIGRNSSDFETALNSFDSNKKDEYVVQHLSTLHKKLEFTHNNKKIFNTIKNSIILSPHEYVNFKLNVKREEDISVCQVNFDSESVNCNANKFGKY